MSQRRFSPEEDFFHGHAHDSERQVDVEILVEEGHFAYGFKKMQLCFVGLDARVFLALLSSLGFFCLVLAGTWGYVINLLLFALVFMRERHARQVSFGVFSLWWWTILGAVAQFISCLVWQWHSMEEWKRVVASVSGQEAGMISMTDQIYQQAEAAAAFPWLHYFLTDGLRLLWLLLLCWQFFAAWQGNVLYLPFARGAAYRLYRRLRPGMAWK